MPIIKITAIVLVILGAVVFTVGISLYRKSCTPNTCIVSFSKSLGGKASMAYEDSLQQAEYCGIAGIFVGGIFIFTGGTFLLKSRNNT